MNIFFIASIKGGRELQPHFNHIAKELENYGEVETSVSEATMSQFGETELADTEIFEREVAALEACDAVVAEVTTPSLGVGYLIARAISLGKDVHVLYHGTDTLKLSSIIKGDQGVAVHTYSSKEEVGEILATIFGG